MQRKESRSAALVGIQIGATPWGESVKVLKNGTAYDPAISLLDIYLKDPKTLI